MALYQTSKEITKFTISGIIAVMVDFFVYYTFSNVFGNADSKLSGPIHYADIYKGLGFIAGTFVTYNINKYWTWRQTDKNKKRLANFFMLYLISFVVNIGINAWGLSFFKDNEIALLWTSFNGEVHKFFPFKTDRLFAFILATGVTSVVNFVGQKLWIFKDSTSAEDDLE
ncbi:MAG: GtrA family protein [Flavobacteriales bacterium]|nr:GtrA family protein [Flavobacteriales bacterium]